MCVYIYIIFTCESIIFFATPRTACGTLVPWPGIELTFTALEVQSLFPVLILFIFGCTGSSLLCMGFLWFQWVGATLRYPPLLESGYSRVSEEGTGFSCCRAWAPGHSGFRGCVLWAPEHRLKSYGTGVSIALKHMESSQTRNQTCIVPCISRQILNHWRAREITI